jgi:tRNA-splicing ligase RtcB
MIEIESKGVPIKAWVEGVPVEDAARKQLQSIARLPVVGPHIAVMPDVHLGKGATVGSVVPTHGAIIPAAVGVDIGCGMMAMKTNLRADDLPDSLAAMRSAIEAAVPHGRSNNGGKGDCGAWSTLPVGAALMWLLFIERYNELVDKHPGMRAFNTVHHLGTLGTGNHFVEVCLDKADAVWVMLHSGSRGVGNRIGSYFIELAKNDMRETHGNLPEDQDLAYLLEGTQHFDDYVAAVGWAQDFALANRKLMMENVLDAIDQVVRDAGAVGEGRRLGEVGVVEVAVNCHHNYVASEQHFGRELWITRKGAVSARAGELGIIPGSMGARSFIVRGLGNPESFHSCSHGAGRAMSRGEAKRRFTLDDHAKATAGIECRKDAEVIDETPAAYKSIDAVMAAQADLVEVVAELRQVLCVKG